MLDGRGRLDGDLDLEAHNLVRTALRVTETRDLDGEPPRAPAQRRADALAAVCRSTRLRSAGCSAMRACTG